MCNKFISIYGRNTDGKQRRGGTERPKEEINDGQTDADRAIGDTVIQFTIWPSIYLPDIISAIRSPSLRSLSLQRERKWDFLTKTPRRRRRFKVKANQRWRKRWH